MACELCGKPATTKARVEGAVLSVCASCATLGTEIKAAPAIMKRTTHVTAQNTFVVTDLGARIRKARNALKLTEKDAAQKLGIKESVLLHLEAGKMQPDDVLVHKLERFYNIKLEESYE